MEQAQIVAAAASDQLMDELSIEEQKKEKAKKRK